MEGEESDEGEKRDECDGLGTICGNKCNNLRLK